MKINAICGKALGVILVIAVIFPVANMPSNTIYALSGNLLVNPGFENGLTSWSTSQGSAVYSVDSTTWHSGLNSAKGVETNAGSLGRLYQDVTIIASPGNQYQITGWIKTSGVTGAAVIALDYVASGGWTPADGYVKEIGYVSGTADWTFFESTVFTLPPMPPDANSLWFLLDFNAGTGTAWLDDLSLIRINSPPVPASSNQTIGFAIAGFIGLMAFIILRRLRSQPQSQP